MAEALARPEDINHLALVDELNGSLANDEEVLGHRPVLEQQRLTRPVAPLPGDGRDGQKLSLFEPVEGGEVTEEFPGGACVHALHY